MYARIVIHTALALVAATAVNLLLRALGIALFDIPDSFEELDVRPVVVSTVAGVVAAGLVFALVARLARAPVRTYLFVVVVVLVLSLWPPLSVDAGTGARLTMAAMHVVTAAICFAVITRAAGPSRARASA